MTKKQLKKIEQILLKMSDAYQVLNTELDQLEQLIMDLYDNEKES